MNDAELCGRVLRVSFARPQRFKEGPQKPIWMQEEYHKTTLQPNGVQENKEKKMFA